MGCLAQRAQIKAEIIPVALAPTPHTDNAGVGKRKIKDQLRYTKYFSLWMQEHGLMYWPKK